MMGRRGGDVEPAPGWEVAYPAGMVQVVALDHLVLLTPDVERSLGWWTDQLGLAGERVDEWRRGAVPFPSVRIDDATIIDLLQGERTGSNVDHVCVVVDPATDLEALVASESFDVERGPVEVFGARGVGRSVYVRDPDGNVVELRTYPAGG